MLCFPVFPHCSMCKDYLKNLQCAHIVDYHKTILESPFPTKSKTVILTKPGKSAEYQILLKDLKSA